MLINNNKELLNTTGFRYSVLNNVFEDDFYQRLCEERRQLSYRSYSFGKLATVKNNPDSAFHYFHTQAWRNHVQSMFELPITNDIRTECHQHPVPGVMGEPHTDLVYCFFNEKLNEEGINSHDDLSSYQKGPALHTRVRAITFLYYLDNNEWADGDGGETLLYKETSPFNWKPFMRVPPINNSMLLFECSPLSFHGFSSNIVSERNSFIGWFHYTKEEAEARYGGKIISW